MDSKNMFRNAEARRVKEQKEIETAIMAETELGTADRQDRQDREKRTTMSVAMSVKEKTMLKQYAAAQGKTAASIIQAWIREFCRNT